MSSFIVFVGCPLKVDETRVAIKALAEANEERKKLVDIMKGDNNIAYNTKKLFREENKSKLIKLGFALIAFPEPTPISPIVGSSLIAAGAVQKGIRGRAAFVEDIGKDFKKALKDLSLSKDLV